MTTTGMTLQEARAVIADAEIVLAEKRLQQLEEQHEQQTLELRRLDDQIAVESRELGERTLQFQIVWGEREKVLLAKRQLADELPEFPTRSEVAAYETKLAAFSDKYDSFTKEIVRLGNLNSDHHIHQLKFDRGRMALGIESLRQAIADARGRKRF
jgi:hypothetical protein